MLDLKKNRMRGWIKRGVLKAGLFAVFALVVLNPNFKRAAMQVQHWFAPEQLIQPDLPEMAGINRAINRMQEEHPNKKETELVEAFVYENIKYASDYATWGNIEYWPTAAEVWKRRQEDCDGRAILAVSIMRSRGFHSAQLVVGLNHMWVQVNENEKDRTKPEKITALLNPEGAKQFELSEETGLTQYATIVAAFLHPSALQKNGAALMAEIPPLRKGLLIVLLLVLVARPSWKSYVAVSSMGVLAVVLLSRGSPELDPAPWELGWALILLLMGCSIAGLSLKCWRTKIRKPVSEPSALKTHFPSPIRFSD